MKMEQLSDLTPEEQSRILIRALEIAVSAHDGQRRKDFNDPAGESLPYIIHPLRVAARLRGNLKSYLAALLHDVIEDTDVTEAQLRQEIPGDIVDAVLALSRQPGETYDQFITRVLKHPFAWRVKLADVEDNLKGLPMGHRLEHRYLDARARLHKRLSEEEGARSEEDKDEASGMRSAASVK